MQAKPVRRGRDVRRPMAHFRVGATAGPVVCMQVMRPGIHVLAAGGNNGVADMPAVLKNRRR